MNAPTALEVLRAATPRLLATYAAVARGELPAARVRTELRRRRRQATRAETRRTLRVLEKAMVVAATKFRAEHGGAT